MAAIGSVWAAGSWADDVWADGTWADATAGVVVPLDDDQTTAFSQAIAALPAGGANQDVNDRLNAETIAAYGPEGDLTTRLSYYLPDIRE